MRIANLIPPEDILLDVNVKDKPHALKFIAEELSIDRDLDPEQVRAALAAREELGSTGIGGGIAFPHTCLPNLDTSLGLFVRASPPIEFDSIDGRPVDLIFTVISPALEKCGPDKPLSILAALSRLLKDKATVQALRQARSVSSCSKILYQFDALAANPVG